MEGGGNGRIKREGLEGIEGMEGAEGLEGMEGKEGRQGSLACKTERGRKGGGEQEGEGRKEEVGNEQLPKASLLVIGSSPSSSLPFPFPFPFPVPFFPCLFFRPSCVSSLVPPCLRVLKLMPARSKQLGMDS
jgi:hypothetical protein